MPVPLLFGPYGGAKRPQDLWQYGVNAIWFSRLQCETSRCLPPVRPRRLRRVPNLSGRFCQTSRPHSCGGRTGGRSALGPLSRACVFRRPSLFRRLKPDCVMASRHAPPAGNLAGLPDPAPAGLRTPSPDLQDSCFCRACIDDFLPKHGHRRCGPRSNTGGTCPRVGSSQVQPNRSPGGGLMRGIIRDRLPQCVIGAYMCPWRPEEFDGALGRIFAQDYQFAGRFDRCFHAAHLRRQERAFTSLGLPVSWVERRLRARQSPRSN